MGDELEWYSKVSAFKFAPAQTRAAEAGFQGDRKARILQGQNGSEGADKAVLAVITQVTRAKFQARDQCQVGGELPPNRKRRCREELELMEGLPIFTGGKPSANPKGCWARILSKCIG